MLYKSKQACAYADGNALIARNMPALREMLITLQENGVKYGLYIEETKYMKITGILSFKINYI
jgi:hypothetical protein